MDWNLAIAINRTALKRILAMLVAMAGLPVPLPSAGVAVRPTLPRHLHRAVLRLLRPAEAAARRLIIVAASGLVLPFTRQSGPEVVMSAGFAAGPAGTRPLRANGGNATPSLRCSLPLFDPLPRFCRRQPVRNGVPRISLPGLTRPAPLPPPPCPDDPIDATRLALRLQALERALDDLPGHARRFARWRSRTADGAQRKQYSVTGAPIVRRWPLRTGRPPGWRRRNRHEVHEILARTNGLALHVLEVRDTS
jgi:hypothetical protein